MSSPGRFFGLTRADWIGVWLVVLTAVVGYGLIAVWPAYTDDPARVAETVDAGADAADPSPDDGSVSATVDEPGTGADASSVPAPGSCEASDGVEVRFLGQEWCADPEAATLLGVMLLGAIGSLVFLLRSYALHRGKGNFGLDWTWWYVLRALSGAGLAVLVYLGLRGGLLATSATASELNKFGLGAASALAGLFSNDAIKLLNRQFAALLGSGEPDDGGNGDQPDSAQNPKPDESAPSEGEAKLPEST